MIMKNLSPRFTKLLILLYLTLLPAAAFSAPDMSTLPPKAVFDCEQKAAAFTKELGKSGDPDIYKRHLQQCLELVEPAPANVKATLAAPRKTALRAKTDPPIPAAACTAADGSNGHLYTFMNTSGEKIWIGVWDASANSKKGSGVTPPAGWANWELDSTGPNSQHSWCAPEYFNGRFIIRAKCDTATGVCQEGNCCNPINASPNSCSNMMCNIGAEPSSLAEFTFDDKKVSWYDVSYVDGYNFPVMIQSSDDKCATLGSGTTQICDKSDPPKCNDVVGTLPDCPWPTSNGVCFGPYRQYALNNPWHDYEQNYYNLASKCTVPGDICGCGNQCVKDGKGACPTTFDTKHPVTGESVKLNSSGCSPFNTNYNGVSTANPPIPKDEEALQQVVCDPLNDQEPEKSYDKKNTCHFKWPETGSAPDYRKYVKDIHAKNPKAYTWQYHDDDSLTQCPTQNSQAFSVTIGPRPTSGKGNAYVLSFNSDPAASGTIAIGTLDKDKNLLWGPSSTFLKGVPQQRAVQVNNKVRIANNCGCPDAKTQKATVFTCIGTYDATNGLTSDDADGSVCKTAANSGIKWGDTKNIAIGKPNDQACGCRSGKFVFYQGDKFHAQITISDNAGNKTKLADIGDRSKAVNPYEINETLLKASPNVELVVDCMNFPPSPAVPTYPAIVKTATCYAAYDDSTGFMTLKTNGTNGTDCFGAAASMGFDATTYKSKPDALFPGIPNDAICK